VKWRHVDVALFPQLPRKPENCGLIVEAKYPGVGAEGALGQAKRYAEQLSVRRDVLVTDGLRRLAGKTENTAPVQTLVTQMGGGKTHMLTTLWHLANTGPAASAFPGVGDLLSEAGLTEAPKAKVAVFVGSATGLGGRSRAKFDAERVRKPVSMAVSRDIKKIAKRHEALGRHLDAAIDPGLTFRYAPERDPNWLT